MKSVRLFFLAAFITVNAFGQTAASNKKPIDESTWKSIDEAGYSIQYPDGWDLDTSGQMGTSFMILSKQVTPTDPFRENVNLLIQNLAGYNVTLDQFVDVTKEQIKTMITNSNLVESKRHSENGKTFHKIIYTGDQGVMKFKFQQYYWIQNEKAYILTSPVKPANLMFTARPAKK